jgi:hypothetical protein
MAAAGYSGTPLIKKLGIKEDTKVLLLNAPENYFTLLEQDISTQLCKKKDMPQLVHLFVTSKKIFEKEMDLLAPVWKKNTSITVWVSWYKKSAGMGSDMTEDIIRNYALAGGLVDVKVCAVSELWSGLKLVVPVAKRG